MEYLHVHMIDIRSSKYRYAVMSYVNHFIEINRYTGTRKAKGQIRNDKIIK